jgi:hypothetical protein
VCRRCCKVELSPHPVVHEAEGEPVRTPRAIPLTVVR